MTDAPDSDPPQEEIAYHLNVVGEEVGVLSSALGGLIDDMAHVHEIRNLARGVLEQLPAVVGADDSVRVSLTEGELKVTDTALRLLVDDLGRDQAGERHVAQRILEKLPDEHSIRAITLD